MTGESAGQVLSSEITEFGVPRPYNDAEGKTVRGDSASLSTGPAESKTLSTRGRSMHKNREIPVVPKGREAPGRSGKTRGHNPDMDAAGKSDTGIVPMNAPNKSATVDAEVQEGRLVTKGNSGQPPATRTQSRGEASSGLDGVREAAGSELRLRVSYPR